MDAVARSIVNAGTFYGVGAMTTDISNSGNVYSNPKVSMTSKSTVTIPEINITKIKYSNTALQHLSDRPYMNSLLTIQNITKSKYPVREIHRSNILRWDIGGSYNGKIGTWELVYDNKNNTIYHFLFKGER